MRNIDKIKEKAIRDAMNVSKVVKQGDQTKVAGKVIKIIQKN